MSNLIRPNDATSVRVRELPAMAMPSSAAVAPLEPPPSPDPVLVALEARLTQALAHAQELEGRLTKAELDIAQAYERGVSEGREAGLKSAEDNRRQAQEALAEGISQALGAQQRQLSEMQDLAVLLAQEAVGQIVGDEAHFSALVALVVQRQCALLVGEGVLRVEVSAADFPQGAHELIAALGRPGVEVALGQLPRGACRFQLRLGVVEADLTEQWRRMSDVFASLADAA